MATAPQNEPLEPTPAVGGNDGTTPPQADTLGTTPAPEGGNQDAIDKIVKQRLDRERKKWEAEAAEAAKRARMDEAERLKADLADRDRQIAEAKADAARERQLRALAGKVIDPEAALRLWEDDDTVGTFLKRHPYMAPTQKPDAPAASAGAPQGARSLTIGDFAGKGTAYYLANRHLLKTTQ